MLKLPLPLPWPWPLPLPLPLQSEFMLCVKHAKLKTNKELISKMTGRGGPGDWGHDWPCLCIVSLSLLPVLDNFNLLDTPSWPQHNKISPFFPSIPPYDTQFLCFCVSAFFFTSHLRSTLWFHSSWTLFACTHPCSTLSPRFHLFLTRLYVFYGFGLFGSTFLALVLALDVPSTACVVVSKNTNHNKVPLVPKTRAVENGPLLSYSNQNSILTRNQKKKKKSTWVGSAGLKGVFWETAQNVLVGRILRSLLLWRVCACVCMCAWVCFLALSHYLSSLCSQTKPLGGPCRALVVNFCSCRARMVLWICPKPNEQHLFRPVFRWMGRDNFFTSFDRLGPLGRD